MSLFKNIKKAVNNKVEGWLFKEEREFIENNPNQPNQSNQPSLTNDQMKEVITALKEMEQSFKANEDHAKQEMKIVMDEDHTISPTQADIDRYFGYHTNYILNVNHAVKTTGMWVTDEKVLFEKNDFDTKGRVEGWGFLRKSCGLPQGNLNSQPWNSKDLKNWYT